jgi:hypothetical protein
MTGVILQSVFTEDASLAFIFFIAFSLMTVLGIRFALYAYWNLIATDLEAQAPLWEYLLFVGLAAALYGILGAVETASAVTQLTGVIDTPYRDGVLLAFLLLLSLTMREIYYNHALSNDDSTEPFSNRRTVEMSFGLVVTTTVFATGILGVTTVLTVLEGVSAVVFAAYGLEYGRRQLSRSSVRGTMIDSLLRHLLPVVTFTVLVLVVDLTIPLGLSVAVARHIQVVFVIMTATALMTSTIKLRQNVTSF